MMFTQEERLIFKYNSAGRPCVADPLRLLQRMMTKASQESVDADFKLLSIDKPESISAFLRLADLARYVFDMKQLSVDEKGDVQGVTDAEALTLLVEFSTWIEEVQGRFFSKLRPLNSTVPASLSSAASPSPTSASAACG